MKNEAEHNSEEQLKQRLVEEAFKRTQDVTNTFLRLMEIREFSDDLRTSYYVLSDTLDLYLKDEYISEELILIPDYLKNLKDKLDRVTNMLEYLTDGISNYSDEVESNYKSILMSLNFKNRHN